MAERRIPRSENEMLCDDCVPWGTSIKVHRRSRGEGGIRQGLWKRAEDTANPRCRARPNVAVLCVTDEPDAASPDAVRYPRSFGKRGTPFRTCHPAASSVMRPSKR